MLLLDEATSHLDVITEAQINTELDKLACTRIVIAHRISTVQNADRIVFLEQGVVVEQGKHDVLLAKAGLYSAMQRACVTSRCQGEVV